MKRIVIDFDGVIHAYTSPWEGADVVRDGLVPGAIDAIKEYQDAGFTVAIHSSRSGQFGGIAAMKSWLYAELLAHFAGAPQTATHVLNLIEWPTDLLPAILYINDRGYQFTGDFPPVDYLKEFTPWNKL
jgi:hypothetical protein